MTESISIYESTNARYLRKKKEKLLRIFGDECKKCRAKNGDIKKIEKEKNEIVVLQFAHKVGFRLRFGEGRGKRKRLLAVERNPEQFELFCRWCHLEYDKENPLQSDELIPF
jgi:hypothetical protein